MNSGIGKKTSLVLTMSNGPSSDGDAVAKQLEVNGAQLYCVQYGSGPHPVLLIPGAVLGTDHAFAPQYEHFGRQGSGYTVVGYDLRGYGKSRPPRRTLNLFPEHFHKTDARDGYRLMTSLGFTEFSVLGWCGGGISALLLAAQFPAAVRKVVVWGAKAFLTQEDIEAFEKIKDVNKWSPHLRAPVEEVYGFEELSRLWVEVLESRKCFLSARPDGDLCMSELSMVKCPTLILHGDKDFLCSQSHAEYLRDHIAESQLHIVAGGKHDLNIHSSVEFNAVVDEFLQE